MLWRKSEVLWDAADKWRKDITATTPTTPWNSWNAFRLLQSFRKVSREQDPIWLSARVWYFFRWIYAKQTLSCARQDSDWYARYHNEFAWTGFWALDRKRHREYGVRPETFETTGEALVFMLESVLKDDFNQAWSKTYVEISNAMTRAQENAWNLVEAYGIGHSHVRLTQLP